MEVREGREGGDDGREGGKGGWEGEEGTYFALEHFLDPREGYALAVVVGEDELLNFSQVSHG